ARTMKRTLQFRANLKRWRNPWWAVVFIAAAGFLVGSGLWLGDQRGQTFNLAVVFDRFEQRVVGVTSQVFRGASAHSGQGFHAELFGDPAITGHSPDFKHRRDSHPPIGSLWTLCTDSAA